MDYEPNAIPTVLFLCSNVKHFCTFHKCQTMKYGKLKYIVNHIKGNVNIDIKEKQIKNVRHIRQH